MVDKFDLWIRSGPFKPLDLAIYRILYSVGVLCVLPNVRWLADYPDSMYNAPPGPFQLLSGFPTLSVLTALEIIGTFSLVLLALGMWTRWMSITVALILLVTYGLTYTLGKIDHTIFLVITPLLLAFSNWGDRLSIDALRKHQEPRPAPQWPLRFLALIVGLSFLETAVIKFSTGWLELSNQAVRGYFIEFFTGWADNPGVAGWIVHLDYAPAWESLDWATVILEFAIFVTVPWWRAFRLALSCAALFHLGVYLVMDIAFPANVIAYGAFVSWGTIAAYLLTPSSFGGETVPKGGDLSRSPNCVSITLLLGGFGVGVGVWLLKMNTDALYHLSRVLLIFIGAAIGAMYLANQAAVGVRRLKPRARAL